MAFTVHEIFVHALDDKDGKNNIATKKEHEDFYLDPDFYKNIDPSGEFSAFKYADEFVVFYLTPIARICSTVVSEVL